MNGQRKMMNENKRYLRYEIYTSSNQSKVWNEKNVVGYQSESLAPYTFQLYAYLSAGQQIEVGTYTDHLIVSMKVFPTDAVKVFPVLVKIVFKSRDVVDLKYLALN